MRLTQLTSLLYLVAGNKAAIPKDAILLSQVQTLTLHAEVLTSHRRVPPIPQLECQGPGCAFYEVDVMRCKNQGYSYDREDIEWSCSANLPREFKLGSTNVICEGYSSSNDKYVLKGSCGVQYRLLLTDIGEEKYASHMSFSKVDWTFSRSLFTIIFLTIFFWILYSAFKMLPGDNLLRRVNRFWGGGGDGGGDPWNPPPPYTRKRYSDQQRSEGWAPGFWSGMLGGAAAGYMAGNRTTRPEPYSSTSSRLFGDTYSDNIGPRRTTSRTSSARYESTGFGTTSRR